MPEKASERQQTHNFIPPLIKKMAKETDQAEAFRVYNRGIVLQVQTYARNKDWTGLSDFIESINTETEALLKPLLVENKASSATA